jgi:hypothetical protein
MYIGILFFSGIIGLCAADSPEQVAMLKELERFHVPEKLVPKGKQPLFLFRAEGVQIYAAALKNGKLGWELQAPKADLLDYRTGEKIGTHSAGPIWVANDGSKLAGKKLDEASSPNADAIAWLLVETKNDNGGRFSKVTHIQRIDTWAGRAPAVGNAKAGDTKEVRYQATYVFWGD